jgi:hypothetical protein
MPGTRWLRSLCWSGPACVVALSLAACQSSRRELSSPNPLERALAIVRLAEAGDASAVHELVDLLEDSDRAVRMYAIMGLRRLCGEDYGYKFYASDAERAAAVRRWRDALRAGEVVVRRRPAAPAGEPQPGEPDESTGSPGTGESEATRSGRP